MGHKIFIDLAFSLGLGLGSLTGHLGGPESVPKLMKNGVFGIFSTLKSNISSIIPDFGLKFCR